MGNFVTQRPLTLPRTLTDFVVKSANDVQIQPLTWLVNTVARYLHNFETRGFNKSREGCFHDSAVKLILRLPSSLDDRLDQLADRTGTTANAVIYQILLSAFEEESQRF